MQKFLIVTFSVLGFLFSSQLFAEAPYGADGIPFIVRESTLIGSVSSVTKKDTVKKFVIFEIQLKDLKRGSAKADEKIEVTAYGETETYEPDLNNKIVFLTDVDQYAQKETGHPVRAVLFVLDLDKKAEVQAIDEYLSAKDPKQKLEWTHKYLLDADSFLQRSALYSIRSGPDSFKLFGKALEQIFAGNNWREAGIAARLLGSANAPDANDFLSKFALDPKNDNDHRVGAIYSLTGSESGQKVLLKWADSSDPNLDPIIKQPSQKLCAELGIWQYPMTNDTWQKFEKALNSGDKNLVVEAADAGQKYRLDEKQKKTVVNVLIKTLKDVLQNDKNEIGTPLLLADLLSAYPSLDSVTQLKSMALDASLDQQIRATAVMGLAKIPMKEAHEALKKIAQDADDKSIRDLASSVLDLGKK